MSSNPGLENINNFLKKERDRFLRSGRSGYFYDSEHCRDTAYIIESSRLELLIKSNNKINDRFKNDL